MIIEFRTEPTLRLHGYSPESPANILARISAGAKPSSLKGDFVLVAEGTDGATGKPLTAFVSTAVAAVPYFYHVSDSGCVHAGTVFDCCRAAGLTWRWNWDALAQLALFDHLLGDVSLHAAISRVPQASIMTVCGTKVELYTEPFWGELCQGGGGEGKLTEASSLFLEILGELPASGGYSLSLSAGYDSRLLLAGLTYLKRNVTAASMGTSDATDPRIAQQIARRVGCDFRRVEITPEEYVTHADDILMTTSGEKVFWHWHTGIFSRKVGFDATSVHLAGSNGEFARSYYFDKGFVAHAVDRVKFIRWDQWLTLKNAARRRVVPEILASMAPAGAFLHALDARVQMKKVGITGVSFGDGLDIFYASERVRHFIGAGLALYRSCFPTMSPFLDARFIRYAAGLPRRYKLGDRLPRSVIGRLLPELLDFPTDESGRPMRSDPDPFYFLKRGEQRGYQRYRDAQQLPRVITWARSGFLELGGSDRFDTDRSLQEKVQQWNLPITIGATVELLTKSGITI